MGPEREEAGVVPVPGRREAVQHRITDGEVRRTDAQDGRARQLLKGVSGRGQITLQLGGRQPVEPQVAIGVARHLVALIDDAAYQAWILPSDPSQHEERRAGPRLREYIEHLVRVRLASSPSQSVV